MLTTATTAVDAPRTVMWSISQIAGRDGVSKQAVSKRVRDLVGRHGLAVERSMQGAIVAVNVAEYDHLRERFDDPSKMQAPRRPAPASAPDPVEPNESYDEALRQKTWHEAEKRRIELEELSGKLVRTADVNAAMDEAVERINLVVDRLPNAADDLAAAVAREGSHGLRVALKDLAVKLRGELADAFAAMGEKAGEAA
jgi:hypothetical protein